MFRLGGINRHLGPVSTTASQATPADLWHAIPILLHPHIVVTSDDLSCKVCDTRACELFVRTQIESERFGLSLHLDEESIAIFRNRVGMRITDKLPATTK